MAQGQGGAAVEESDDEWLERARAKGEGKGKERETFGRPALLLGEGRGGAGQLARSSCDSDSDLEVLPP